ncbi:MAG: hypothetical protein Q8L29_04250 [archaeon]|nr:hypothetical protein [archaeon]
MATSTTILSSPFFVEGVLPFLLVFVLVYAVLQKSKILGDDKKQINAIVSLVIGLIVISFNKYVSIIVNLIPVLAVGLVIILVFLLLWGIVFVNEDFAVAGWVKWTFGGLAFAAVLISALIFTEAWSYFKDYFSGDNTLFINIVFLVIVGVAVAVVVGFGGKNENSSSSSGKNK